jgi:hypothetical protein
MWREMCCVTNHKRFQSIIEPFTNRFLSLYLTCNFFDIFWLAFLLPWRTTMRSCSALVFTQSCHKNEIRCLCHSLMLSVKVSACWPSHRGISVQKSINFKQLPTTRGSYSARCHNVNDTNIICKQSAAAFNTCPCFMSSEYQRNFPVLYVISC